MEQERALQEIPQQAASPAVLLQIAVQQGADLDRLERLMALQERWEKGEAVKAFNDAFARFKAAGVRIVKNKTVSAGPMRGMKHADLFAVVDALTPELSAHGLAASWKLTKDEKDWLEVTCILRHVAGHSEQVAMGGAPDTSGAKNSIQARASTKTYLERYTFLAAVGMAATDEDDDGAGGAGEQGANYSGPRADAAAALIRELRTTATDSDALAFWNRTKGSLADDKEAYRLLRDATVAHRNAIKEGKA